MTLIILIYTLCTYRTLLHYREHYEDFNGQQRQSKCIFSQDERLDLLEAS
jgi:hypothetical protein